jgi:hypothetical protein
MSHLKLSVLLVAGVLALAPYGQAANNLVQNPRFMTAPVDPATEVAANWAYFNTASATSAVTTQLAPGLRFASVDGAVGATTSDRGVTQVIPVVQGAKYFVNASWRGVYNVGTSSTGGGCFSRARCYVAFGTSSTGPWTGELNIYNKTLAYARDIASWGVPRSLFTSSSAGSSSYDWSATWENMNTCFFTAQPVVYANDVLTVPAPTAGTNTYMRLRLSFDTALQPAQSGTPQSWVEFDNVSVSGCQGAIAGDVDGDCNVDVMDLAQLANTWLICGNTSNNTLCW